MIMKVSEFQALGLDKQNLAEQFISGCQDLNLSCDESVELAARIITAALISSGESYAKIEIDGVHVVEVCTAKKIKLLNLVTLGVLAVGFTALIYFAVILFMESKQYGIF